MSTTDEKEVAEPQTEVVQEAEITEEDLPEAVQAALVELRTDISGATAKVAEAQRAERAARLVILEAEVRQLQAEAKARPPARGLRNSFILAEFNNLLDDPGSARDPQLGALLVEFRTEIEAALGNSAGLTAEWLEPGITLAYCPAQFLTDWRAEVEPMLLLRLDTADDGSPRPRGKVQISESDQSWPHPAHLIVLTLTPKRQTWQQPTIDRLRALEELKRMPDEAWQCQECLTWFPGSTRQGNFGGRRLCSLCFQLAR